MGFAQAEQVVELQFWKHVIQSKVSIPPSRKITWFHLHPPERERPVWKLYRVTDSFLLYYL